MRKFTLWAKLLFLEGLVLLGLGFGWGLGTRAGPSLTPVFVLVGAGFLSVLASLALWRGILARRSRTTRMAAIDLGESEKALLVHKTQPPVIQGDGYRTDHLLIPEGERVRNLPTPLLIENWRGAEIEVQIGEGGVRLAARQILRVDPGEGRTVDLYAPPFGGSAFVLVHFLSPSDGLE